MRPFAEFLLLVFVYVLPMAATAQEMTFTQTWTFLKYEDRFGVNVTKCSSNAPSVGANGSELLLQVVAQVIHSEQSDSYCDVGVDAEAKIEVGPEPTQINIGCRLVALWELEPFTKPDHWQVRFENAKFVVKRAKQSIENVLCEPVPNNKRTAFRDEFLETQDKSICLPAGEYELSAKLRVGAAILNGENLEPFGNMALVAAHFSSALNGRYC